MSAATAAAADDDDRLSKLPDGILADIVSRLATDEMVRTSVLSSRWRRLWTASPVLHFTRAFSSDTIDPDDYPAIVDNCLPQCSASGKLRSARFPLTKNYPAFPASLDRWISFAAARGVEELALTPIIIGRLRVELPISLFDCRLLSTLRLSSCSIFSVPASADFPNLLSLVLTNVSIDSDGLDALLSVCPRLEQLSISFIKELTRLLIRAPMMRHLMVYSCLGLKKVEIQQASELRRLMYGGDILVLGSLDGVVPKLEEALLLSTERDAFIDSRCWRDFVASIAHVKVLSVNSWFIQFMLGKDFDFGDRQNMFENLKELHFWPVFKKSQETLAGSWDAEGFSVSSLHRLISIVRKCSALEHLCILGTYYLEQEADEFDMVAYGMADFGMVEVDYGMTDTEDSDNYSDDEDNLLQEFHGVLPNLKIVRLTEFSGKVVEKQLVQFLLDRAVSLKSVSLHYVGEIQDELNSIHREMRAFHKASPLAQISFSEFDEDKVCPKHENIWYDFMVI